MRGAGGCLLYDSMQMTCSRRQSRSDRADQPLPGLGAGEHVTTGRHRAVCVMELSYIPTVRWRLLRSTCVLTCIELNTKKGQFYYLLKCFCFLMSQGRQDWSQYIKALTRPSEDTVVWPASEPSADLRAVWAPIISPPSIF